MPATPQRCAAVARFTFRMLFCSTILLLVACSSKQSGLIAPPTATTGDISITVSSASYASHQAIGVTVANTSKTSYYATNGLSACTYLQLEFYDSTRKAWLGVDGCTSVIATHALLLAPSSTLPYTLAPGDSSSDPNAWVPGVYRISLRYGAAADGTGSLVVVYSPGFKITS